MKATIIRFEELIAICIKEDRSIIDIKRLDIPREAQEGDVLNITEASITLENKVAKEKYLHIDDIIIDIEE